MNTNEVKNSLKTLLLNLYSASWEKDRKEIVHGKSSSKLELHAFVKLKQGFEKYLCEITDFKKQNSITHMRLSSYKFPIETGRYKKTSRTQRLCTICDRDEMGDEFHYFFHCDHSSITLIRIEFSRKLFSFFYIRSFQYFSLLDINER